MNLDIEPLQYVPPGRWKEVQEILKKEWPGGVLLYHMLKWQNKLFGKQLNLKLYCLFGDALKGVVAIDDRLKCFEIMIYNNCDAGILEEILKKTNVIDWKRFANFNFNTDHTSKYIQNNVKDLNHDNVTAVTFDHYILDKYTPAFEDISIPPGIQFDYVKEDNLEMITSLWPYRYSHSAHCFEELIKKKSAFGLYHNGHLICWVFIGVRVILAHLFTVEEHRKKGYAKLLVKLVSNILLGRGHDVCLGVSRDNLFACKLYPKLGFRRVENIFHSFLKEMKVNVSPSHFCRTDAYAIV